MDAQEILSQLPRGKEDKPFLLSFAPLEYSRTDTDGLYYMLDRDFSGCTILPFTKPMNTEISGRAYIDGTELPPCVLKQMPLMFNLFALGVKVRGFVEEYGKTYTLRIEGFVDTDGNEMDPAEFPIKCTDRVLPQESDAAHEAVALQAARDGAVLLKNENGALPLAAGSTLNLFGKAVNEFRTAAVGAGKINPRYTVDLTEAVREKTDLTLNEELVAFYRCDEDLVPPEEMLSRAREASDTAVFVITRGTGENMDNSTAKGEYNLTDDEAALVRKLAETFPHVVAVLNVGYPINVSWADELGIDGLLYSGFGGMFGGQAITDVLTGKVNPSGKLADTWPLDYGDLPSSANFYNCVDKPRLSTECDMYLDTVYEEGLYVGYRYFTSFGKAPAYPFGFGLSYTTFDITAEEILWDGASCRACVTVRNTGSVPGREVVQMYAHKPAGIETPERELIAFEKTGMLAPGASETLILTAKAMYLGVYDPERAAWVLPAGEIPVYIGADSRAPLAGSIAVTEELLLKQVSHLMVPAEAPAEMSQFEPAWPAGKRSIVRGENVGFAMQERRHWPGVFETEKPAEKLTYADVRTDPAKAEAFVAQLTVEELARLSVCASDGWGMEGVGEAGRVFKIEGYELPDFPVSDGNSGVNLRIPNIGMPTTVTMTQTFDKALMEQVGVTIGEEAKALGIPLILAPGMNLHRNPLNGRQPEYFSEDPLLAGQMAGLYCRGIESAGVGSCMKHMIANNCESTRKRNMSIIGERTLRELYLRPFEIAMDVYKPASIMTGYNACNGQPTSMDEELLEGFLRRELGFEGITMTDWGSYDTADVAEMVKAGMCWITPGSQDDTYTAPIVQAVADGRIEIERLQENVTFLIRTMARFA